MAVLNTTSPTREPGAPTETPSNTVPSSSARIAGWFTGDRLGWGNPGFAGCKPTRGPAIWRSVRAGVQASGNFSGNPGQWETGPDGSAAALEQQVGDAVAPGRAARQAPRRLQRTAGEDVAAAGAMQQLQPLARAGE